MAEEKAKRARRTVEDRIAEIDAKIAALEAKKQELLRPAKMKKIIEEASANMTPEEMAEREKLFVIPESERNRGEIKAIFKATRISVLVGISVCVLLTVLWILPSSI